RFVAYLSNPLPKPAEQTQAPEQAPDPAPAETAPEPPDWEVRGLWAPKDGHSDDECEDAFDKDESAGVVVVADGAAQGIFVRAWAQTLVSSYLSVRPELTDPESRAAWLKDCRTHWKAGIDYAHRHGMEQDKVDRIGGNATLLALHLERAEQGFRWRAV